MTFSTTHTSEDRPYGIDERAAGALSLVVALASLAFANFAGSGDDGGAGPFLVTAAFAGVVAGVVFGWAVPRAREAGTHLRTALVLTILSVLGVAVFWAGLTQVAAPAAALLALAGLRRDGSRRGALLAVIAVSTIAYLAAIAGCVAG